MAGNDPKTKAPADPAKARYQALTTLHGLGKKPVKAGTVVELDTDQAESLVACQAVRPVGEEPKA